MAEKKNESVLWGFKIAKTHFSKWRVPEARRLRCKSQGVVLWEGSERILSSLLSVGSLSEFLAVDLPP